MSNRRKRIRATAYLDPRPLEILAADSSSASLNRQLGNLAALLELAHHQLRRLLEPADWRYLAAVWDCVGPPDAESMADFSASLQGAVHNSARIPNLAALAWPAEPEVGLRRLQDRLRYISNVEALAIMTAVYDLARVGPSRSQDDGWWEPSHRVERSAQTVARDRAPAAG